MIPVPRVLLAVCALASSVVLFIAIVNGDWWLALLAACGAFGAGIGSLQM